jgi:protein CpxP
MKNLIKRLVMGAMVFGMTTAMAQKGGEKVKLTPEQKIDKKIERLDKELNLDFKQKESIKASSLNQLKEREMLKKEKDVIREKMKALKEAYQKDIRAVLTPEQVVKMKDLQKERHAKRIENKKKIKEHQLKE